MTIERLAYRVREFADAIGVSRAKGYEMVASGKVPSIEIGGVKRVPVDAVRQLIERQLEAQKQASA